MTGDLAKTIWGSLLLLVFYLEADVMNVVRKLKQKEARIKLDQFELLPEYQSEARDSRTLVATLTTIVASFTYFAYTTGTFDAMPFAVASTSLFAFLWVAVEWSRFLCCRSWLLRCNGKGPHFSMQYCIPETSAGEEG